MRVNPGRARKVGWILLGFLTAACGRPPAGHDEPAPRPDVLLITIDSLRADRIGTGLAPTLDGLASRGQRFTRAYTVAPLSLPAHVSLLTGLLPPDHGVRLDDGRFRARQLTLARAVRDAGFETAAFVGSHVLDRASGIASGFTTYDDRVRRDWVSAVAPRGERSAAEVADAVLVWFAARRTGPAQRPIFVWAQFNEPHAPHVVPAGVTAAPERHPYDGEVAFVDSQVGRLLDAVRASGRESTLLVVVTSDHGESLGDHGERTHGLTLYESAVRVPLIIAGAGVPAGVRTDVASLIDVAPTVLTKLGVGVGPSMTGRDLLAPLRAGAVRSEGTREVYAETRLPEAAGGAARAMLTDGQRKLIVGGSTELYDLQRDAGERDNLAAAQPDTVRVLEGRLAAADVTRRGRVGDSASSLGTSVGAGTLEDPDHAGRYARSPLLAPAAVVEAWGKFEDALALLSRDDGRRGAQALASLARRYPQAKAFQRAHALALQELGRFAEASRVLSALVARWPGDPGLYHDVADAAALAGKADDARRAEQAALGLDPQYAPAHDGLGRLALASGVAIDARRAFETAVAHDPTNARYWANLGLASRELGDAGAAERAFRRALELDADCPHALSGLALLLGDAGRLAESVTLLERVTETNPGFVDGWLHLGLARQKAGRLDEARAALMRVTKAPPRYARQQETAARVLASLAPR